MRKLFYIFFIINTLPLFSQTKTDADSAYARNEYQQAAAMYEQIIEEQGISADVYYNLGNAYFKQDNIAKAILNYERALKLNPASDDIAFNLELANSKTIDKVEAQPSFFITTWYKGLLNSATETTWAVWAIIFFIIAVISILGYLYLSAVIIRKIGFISACICIVLCVIFNIFASQQRNYLLNHTDAIIMEQSLDVKSTPDEQGTLLFVIHEGHKVKIVDDSMQNWKEIQLEDGKQGWVKSTDIEVI